jgi:hypothetical protein
MLRAGRSNSRSIWARHKERRLVDWVFNRIKLFRRIALRFKQNEGAV